MVTGALVWFAVRDWAFPYGRCSKCEGGKIWNARRTAFKRCTKCKGKGERLRAGRAAVARRQRAAKRRR